MTIPRDTGKATQHIEDRWGDCGHFPEYPRLRSRDRLSGKMPG